MQQNNNAGIISYRECRMPQFLSMLALPKLENSIVINEGTQGINIHIIDCPVNGDRIAQKTYKLLREIVDKNRIKFLVEHFETKVQSNVTPRKNEIHYSQLLAEIKAIKQLAVLMKLSQDRQENLLAGGIGFIMGNIDSLVIDLLSDEASSVMVYECQNLTEQLKMKLHNNFMKKKGISIIFTKDINSIIKNSSIIYIDEEIDLSRNVDLLQSKIVIGKSSIKSIKSINNITLWKEELKFNSDRYAPYIYNDEILAIVRYYNNKLDIIEFIKRLPYIYFEYQ